MIKYRVDVTKLPGKWYPAGFFPRLCRSESEALKLVAEVRRSGGDAAMKVVPRKRPPRRPRNSMLKPASYEYAMPVVAEFTHHHQPYGWVKIVDCIVTASDNPCRPFRVTGKVAASRWCGVLVCGVPAVSERDDRWPVGSEYSVDVTAADIPQRSRVDVAM